MCMEYFVVLPWFLPSSPLLLRAAEHLLLSMPLLRSSPSRFTNYCTHSLRAQPLLWERAAKLSSQMNFHSKANLKEILCDDMIVSFYACMVKMGPLENNIKA